MISNVVVVAIDLEVSLKVNHETGHVEAIGRVFAFFYGTPSLFFSCVLLLFE